MDMGVIKVFDDTLLQKKKCLICRSRT